MKYLKKFEGWSSASQLYCDILEKETDKCLRHKEKYDLPGYRHPNGYDVMGPS